MTDDTEGEPIGWKIVATGDDGSLLCEAPNGTRKRYWFLGTKAKSVLAARLAQATELLRDINAAGVVHCTKGYAEIQIDHATRTEIVEFCEGANNDEA